MLETVLEQPDDLLYGKQIGSPAGVLTTVLALGWLEEPLPFDLPPLEPRLLPPLPRSCLVLELDRLHPLLVPEEEDSCLDLGNCMRR